MLGRCRLRRGVSLEVIVEEDDNAEVTFDPSPLMEEDDDDDEDEDSENGTNGSTPNSPRDDDERRGEAEGRCSLEERRKKRERRRTIGGLSRYRSVSCEALTLLDTSDMDSCCSEWDDDDDLAASSSSNYVTLNRPISRRRIIENSQSQCDSEDSGIEYHSNEDDHVLEDHSSNEDHIEVEYDGQDEDEEQHTDKEEEPETNIDSCTPETTEMEDNNYEDEPHEINQDQDIDETETITTISEQDIETLQTDVHHEETDIEHEHLSDIDGIEMLDEQRRNSLPPVQESPKPPMCPSGTFAYSPNEALKNDNIVIVETTPSVPIKKVQQTINKDPVEEEMRLKREAYTIRNKEVCLAELPIPHTVKSVKQLFENLNTPVQHFHAWRDLGRFRDIKSNPSSKILRFDRNDGNDIAVSRSQLMSFTLPRLPSQGGNQISSKNKVPKTDTIKSSIIEAKNGSGKPLKTVMKVPKNYQETPISRILTQSMAMKKAQQEEDSKNIKSQEPLQQVVTQSGEKVSLRKPIVKGFNVKRALMENPRNFLPHSHGHQQEQQQQNNQPKISQKIIRQRSSQNKKPRHHSDLIDRSDTESLASDISDDSGVSNDSLSSMTSSTPSCRSLDAYASDPSFKWIDPSVMSKIRSVGTTVIFFGPRQRPRSEGTMPRGTKSISSGLRLTKGHKIVRGDQYKQKPNQIPSTPKKTTPTRQQEPVTTPVPAPRIVGVMRKQSTGTISNSLSNSPNTTPSTSSQPTPSSTPTPPEAHSEEFREFSPVSHCFEEPSPVSKPRWRSESDTIVYNFTSRPQPPAVYF